MICVVTQDLREYELEQSRQTDEEMRLIYESDLKGSEWLDEILTTGVCKETGDTYGELFSLAGGDKTEMEEILVMKAFKLLEK